MPWRWRQRTVASTSSAAALFAEQPPEGTGGFTTEDLLRLGARVGLTGADFTSGVQTGRYEQWVLSRETAYAAEDPQGPRRRG